MWPYSRKRCPPLGGHAREKVDTLVPSQANKLLSSFNELKATRDEAQKDHGVLKAGSGSCCHTPPSAPSVYHHRGQMMFVL